MSIDLRPYCVAQWKMNETGNTTVMDSNGNHYGTSHNTIVGVAGKIGGAINFNGTSDYVTVPSSTGFNFGTDDFSVCFWVKLSDITTAQEIIDRFKDGYHYAEFFLQAGRFFSELVDTQYVGWGHNAPIPLNAIGNWLFVTFAKTSAGVQIYFDGSPAAMTVGFMDGNPSVTMTTTDIRMGVRYDTINYNYFLNAPLDDVCIFNKALSADEISFLYYGGNGTEKLYGELGEWDGTTVDDLWSNVVAI